jgi:iron complex outermembrane receptor protein
VSRPFANVFYGEFSVFYNDISDRISRDGPYEDSIYRNYSKVHIYGFEAIAEWTPLDDLLFRVGYTYLQAEDKSDGAVTDDVLRAPQNKVDIKVQYIIPKIRTKLDFICLYMGSQYDQLPTPTDPNAQVLETSGYFLANFKATQPLWEHFDLFGYVSNIFDKDYEYESGFPGQGRAFWVGAKASF